MGWSGGVPDSGDSSDHPASTVEEKNAHYLMKLNRLVPPVVAIILSVA